LAIGCSGFLARLLSDRLRHGGGGRRGKRALGDGSVFDTGRREPFPDSGWIRCEDIRGLWHDGATGEECVGEALPIRCHAGFSPMSWLEVVICIDPIRSGLVYEH
jgi:hypothetical protein